VARRAGVTVGLKSIAAHILSELIPLDGLGIQLLIYEGNVCAASASIRRPFPDQSMMSAWGQTRKSAVEIERSGLTPKADSSRASRHVGFVPKPEVDGAIPVAAPAATAPAVER
jgi:hypothetical protein